MEAYQCVKCGIITPITDHNGKILDKARICFRCGCKQRVKIILPNFVQSKSGRRRRFAKKGSIITRIGV